MNLQLALPIIQAGFSGLAFLLAYLAYLLLRAEGARTKTRDNMLHAIDRFALFSVMLGVLSAGSVGLEGWFQHTARKADATSTSSLKAENANLTKRLAELQAQSVKLVFKKVCTQNRFDCTQHMTADSESAKWRPMTLNEVQICTLACNY